MGRNARGRKAWDTKDSLWQNIFVGRLMFFNAKCAKNLRVVTHKNPLHVTQNEVFFL
jgi:hypothetical protein